MKTDCWGTFMMTGQVKDYLEYKQEECHDKYEQVRGERRDEAERFSHRDGASNDGYW